MTPRPPADSPNAARMYDYYLGGSANLASDRELADQVIAARPELPAIARANRAFLGRAVRHLVEQGIDQFLDLGSGIPTVGNVHEVAHRIDPRVRVAYVDHEPVAVAYARHLLADDTRIRVVQADLRDAETVLAESAELLDLGRPLALLAVAVLHFLTDEDDPHGALTAYRQALVPGSHLVLSHGTTDRQPAGAVTGTQMYQQSTSPLTLRTREEVTALLAGFTVCAPGVVFTPEWRIGESVPARDEFAGHPERAGFYAALARLDR